MCRIGTKIFGAYYTDFALAEELKLFLLVCHCGDFAAQYEWIC